MPLSLLPAIPFHPSLRIRSRAGSADVLAGVPPSSSSLAATCDTGTALFVAHGAQLSHQGETDLMITVEMFHVAFEDAPVHVATLTSDQPHETALEEAFTATQNLESSWVQSRGQRGISVAPTKDILERNDWRSTSMGDYARVVDEDGTESFFRCCAVGWKVITNPEDLDRVGDAAMFAGHLIS